MIYGSENLKETPVNLKSAKDLGIVFRDETVDIQPFAQLVKSDIEAYLAGKYS